MRIWKSKVCARNLNPYEHEQGRGDMPGGLVSAEDSEVRPNHSAGVARGLQNNRRSWPFVADKFKLAGLCAVAFM
jgi:hypothetical protein